MVHPLEINLSELTDDELVAQGWFEATEYFNKKLEQLTQESEEEHG